MEPHQHGETCGLCGHVEQPGEWNRCPACWHEWEYHARERQLMKALEQARDLAKRGKKYWYATDN